MKRILFVCCLLTFSCATPFTPAASAQGTTLVTRATFSAKVNTMDGQIAAGNITAAKATWEEINTMLITVLGYTKTTIQSATTTHDRDAAMLVLTGQNTIYQAAWLLKPDLARNRAALRTKLGEFAATF